MMSIRNKSQKITIAIVGQSAAGKSAFIKSFSEYPDLISSEGKGQTTRSYAEYYFYTPRVNKDSDVSVRLYSSEEFSEIRTRQAYEKLCTISKKQKVSFIWLAEQYLDEDFTQEVNAVLIHADDFFNIDEFVFLDKGQCVIQLNEIYNEFIDIILYIGNNSDLPPLKFFNLEKVEKINESHIKRKSERVEEEALLEKDLLELLFQEMYKVIYKDLVASFDTGIELNEENGVTTCNFLLSIENKELLELFLKVIEDDNKKKRSYTALVSKIRINSTLCKEYSFIFENLGINGVTLVDTYGLNHDQQSTEEVLKDRYNKIFNIDYPEVSVVFFIESLLPGSSQDFSTAIINLYEQRPDIMTYVIGTYIDEQDRKLLDSSMEWLLSLEKTVTGAPQLNGRALDFLYNKNTILATLKRNNVHPTLAQKRMEIMRSRFGPYCGKTNLADELKKINCVTVESIFTSIIDREHLGDEYINIDLIVDKLGNSNQIKDILVYMINIATTKFERIYKIAASRTKGKIRINLENYILGFNGTTMDATWYRVFMETYNESFTKEIEIRGTKTSLSKIFELAGNERVAFDELLNTFFPYLFSKVCEKEPLKKWYHEISCYECKAKNEFEETCSWGSLINIAGKEEFHSRNAYDTVSSWLTSLHNFRDMCHEGFYDQFYRIFMARMNSYFIPLSREHNAKIMSNKAKKSKNSFNEEKFVLFEKYKDNYDNGASIKEFFNIINS